MYILVLAEDLTKGLRNATITSEAEYSINFTELGKNVRVKFTLYGGSSILFVNVKICISLKQKIHKCASIMFGKILQSVT